MLDGIFCRHLMNDTQPLRRLPPQGRKKQLILGHWPTAVHADMSQRMKLFFYQQIPYNLTGRLVEDESESAVLCRVIGKQYDGVFERSALHGWRRKEQVSLQFMVTRIGVGNVHVATMKQILSLSRRRRGGGLFFFVLFGTTVFEAVGKPLHHVACLRALAAQVV